MARRRVVSGEARVRRRLKELVEEEQQIEDKLDALRYDRAVTAMQERAELLKELELLGVAIAEHGSLLVEEFSWYIDDRGELRSPR
jgi:hypothetical protein